MLNPSTQCRLLRNRIPFPLKALAYWQRRVVADCKQVIDAKPLVHNLSGPTNSQVIYYVFALGTVSANCGHWDRYLRVDPNSFQKKSVMVAADNSGPAAANRAGRVQTCNHRGAGTPCRKPGCRGNALGPDRTSNAEGDSGKLCR